MEELLKEDLKWCLTRLPKDVIDILKKEGNKVLVSGGYLRSCIANEEIRDIDIFTKNKETSLRLAELLQTKRPDKKIYKTEYAYTVKGFMYPIQFIHKWIFKNPIECIESFDFTIAKSALWFDRITETWNGICDKRFYPDLSAKRLVYCSPIRNEEAGGSILRVLKFYQRGYRIPLDSMGKVIARLVKGVDLEKSAINTDNDWDEELLSSVFFGLLKEVDPATDPNHLGHL